MPDRNPTAPRLFSVAAISVAMVAGIALKADRYSPATNPDFSGFEARVVEFAQATGWRRVAVTGPAETAYRALTFSHPVCARPLTFALLGHTPGLAAHVRHHLGDIELVQEGRVVGEFDVRGLQIATLQNAVARRLALATAPAAPLLAVAPPSSELAETCPGVPRPRVSELYGTTATSGAPAPAAPQRTGAPDA